MCKKMKTVHDTTMCHSVKLEFFSFSWLSSSLCFEAIFFFSSCVFFNVNSDQFKWNAGIFHLYLHSSAPPLPFIPLFFHCSHPCCIDYWVIMRKTALASDQDTGGVTRPFLETALEITLVHCYQHTSVCVCVCLILPLFSFCMPLMDIQSLIIPGG